MVGSNLIVEDKDKKLFWVLGISICVVFVVFLIFMAFLFLKAKGNIDIVVKGEPEITVTELSEAIINGHSINEIPGLVFIKEGKFFFTGEREASKYFTILRTTFRQNFLFTEQILIRELTRELIAALKWDRTLN